MNRNEAIEHAALLVFHCPDIEKMYVYNQMLGEAPTAPNKGYWQTSVSC
jgi:hypothetical protein